MKNDLYVFDDCNNAMALLTSHGKSLGIDLGLDLGLQDVNFFHLRGALSGRPTRADGLR